MQAVNMLAEKMQSFGVEDADFGAKAGDDDAPLWAVAANSEGAKSKQRITIITDLFVDYDPHNDGTSDLPGFVAAMKKMDDILGISQISSSRLGSRVLESIFRKFDAAHTGFIHYKELVEVFSSPGAAVHLFSDHHARKGSVHRSYPQVEGGKKGRRRPRRVGAGPNGEDSEEEGEERTVVSESTLARVRQQKREEQLVQLEEQRRQVEQDKDKGGVQLDSWAIRRMDYESRNAATRDQIAMIEGFGGFPGKMGVVHGQKALPRIQHAGRRGTMELSRVAISRQKEWRKGAQQAWKNGGSSTRHRFTAKRELRLTTSSKLYPHGKPPAGSGSRSGSMGSGTSLASSSMIW
jgi:hypothetical protein